MRLTVTLSIALISFPAVPFAAPAQEVAQLPPGVAKIDDLILWHQREKVRRSDESEPDHRARLLSHGLDPDSLDAEHCALYLMAPLGDAENSEMAQHGIDVDPGFWIPPIPGRHPHGFHLAQVPYASLDWLQDHPRVVRLDSTEETSFPDNNLSRRMLCIQDVHVGNGVVPRNGSGVIIAIGDSGLDVTHPDLADVDIVEALNIVGNQMDGNIANVVSGHGTRVVGTAVGSGLLSLGNEANNWGHYGGMAPGASLAFYKVGNNTNSTAQNTDIIEAIDLAVAAGATVYSSSYSGISQYLDGSSNLCQTVDWATTMMDMAVVNSAGNMANQSRHVSLDVAPGDTVGNILLDVDNVADPGPYTDGFVIQVDWRDDMPADQQMELYCINLDPGETITQIAGNTSMRGTEYKRYEIITNVAAGTAKTYFLSVANLAAAGTTPLVHLYKYTGRGQFENADENYTVRHPAVADTAIAAGVVSQRRTFLNYFGDFLWSGIVGNRIVDSGAGPRIDGAQKPEIMGAGRHNLSLRDSDVPCNGNGRIDNDGLDIDGMGEGDYCEGDGTSYAAPQVAGVIALLKESEPGLTATELRDRILSTARQTDDPTDVPGPDPLFGFGLLDALAASLQPLDFIYPGGRPEINAADGTTTFPVEVIGVDGTPQGGSAVLHYSLDGQSFSTIPLVVTGPTQSDVTLPSAGCLETIQYFISALDDQGFEHTSPSVPGETFEVRVADSRVVVFADPFEIDQGWTIGDPDPANPDDATTGIWERDFPVGTDPQPWVDSPDLGERCFVTQNGAVTDAPTAWDIDGGKTTIISPTLDLSGPGEHYISYWLHYFNGAEFGSPDSLTVDISAADGAPGTWVNAETLDRWTRNWTFHRFRVEDVIDPTATVRIRVVASDYFPGRITEAAFDDFLVERFECDPVFRRGDVNGDGSVNALGDGIFLLTYGFGGGAAPPCFDAADVDDDGSIGALADAVGLFAYGFAGGAPPPPPLATCGVDPTVDALDCASLEVGACP